MDIIWDRLESNNIDINKETPSFHIDTCLKEYGEIYGTAINRIDRNNMSAILCDIYEKLNPKTIDRIMAY